MMMTVMRRPPQRPALYRRRPHYSEHELRGTRGAKSAVRKIAVVEPGDGKHAHRIKRHRHQHGDLADTGPDHAEATQMQRGKR